MSKSNLLSGLHQVYYILLHYFVFNNEDHSTFMVDWYKFSSGKLSVAIGFETAYSNDFQQDSLDLQTIKLCQLDNLPHKHENYFVLRRCYSELQMDR